MYDVSISWTYILLIISVWENALKLKELTTVNYFALRHHQLIEAYTRENSESIQQYARISYIFSWSCQIWLLAPLFFPNVPASYDKRRNLKEKSFPTRVWTCDFFSDFFSLVILVLWLYSGLKYTAYFLDFFLLFNSVTSAVTAYNVGVFKPTVHDLSNSSYWNTTFV